MIVTFYNEKITPIIPKLQKDVFNYFGYEINQIFVSDWVSHGNSIDNFLSDKFNEDDVIVIFDIDSIPLNKNIINDCIHWCKNNIGVFSVAQKTIKLRNPIIYAAPSFMVFSIKTYNLLGRPSFCTNERSDCGAEITHNARNLGIEVRLLYPSHVELPHTELDGYIKFGYGTTYGNNIYHAFESRFKQRNSYFINKCNSILNG